MGEGREKASYMDRRNSPCKDVYAPHSAGLEGQCDWLMVSRRKVGGGQV
jgi:hypothetical protein